MGTLVLIAKRPCFGGVDLQKYRSVGFWVDIDGSYGSELASPMWWCQFCIRILKLFSQWFSCNLVGKGNGLAKVHTWNTGDFGIPETNWWFWDLNLFLDLVGLKKTPCIWDPLPIPPGGDGVQRVQWRTWDFQSGNGQRAGWLIQSLKRLTWVFPKIGVPPNHPF